jgi:hypothetical protein
MSEEKGEPVELLSRFADPDASEEVDLGPCRCPGAPHGRDSATIRAEIGDGELRSAYAPAKRFHEDGRSYIDEAAGDDSVAARFTVSWTLFMHGLDEKRKPALVPVPITARSMSLLDEASRTSLMLPINAAVNGQNQAALPNASGARSPVSSPASASPNRAARRRR